MISERDPGALPVRQLNVSFRVEDAAGQTAREMELHMGMLGHAAFVRCDRTAFAHTPPSGTVPKPALALTQAANPYPGFIMFDPQVEN